MYGKNGNSPAARPPAAEVARIQGNTAFVLVANDPTDGVLLFVNGTPVLNGMLESLTINIVAPGGTEPNGILTALLNFYETTSDGQRETRSVSLFPGTVELIAHGRRITITAQAAGSFEGLWLGLGLRADGTTSEVNGVQSLRVTVTPELLDGKLTWVEDGNTEDLFPG